MAAIGLVHRIVTHDHGTLFFLQRVSQYPLQPVHLLTGYACAPDASGRTFQGIVIRFGLFVFLTLNIIVKMTHVAIEHDEAVSLVGKFIVGLVLEAKGTKYTCRLAQAIGVFVRHIVIMIPEYFIVGHIKRIPGREDVTGVLPTLGLYCDRLFGKFPVVNIIPVNDVTKHHSPVQIALIPV